MLAIYVNWKLSPKQKWRKWRGELHRGCYGVVNIYLGWCFILFFNSFVKLSACLLGLVKHSKKLQSAIFLYIDSLWVSIKCTMQYMCWMWLVPGAWCLVPGASCLTLPRFFSSFCCNVLVWASMSVNVFVYTCVCECMPFGIKHTIFSQFVVFHCSRDLLIKQSLREHRRSYNTFSISNAFSVFFPECDEFT